MKVSVITACLNAASHIERALKSVRDQTYPDIEHVIIDGGSTDGTLDIIDRHRERVGYLVSEPDRSIYNAMNKGIKAATGDVLFFLNADDRFADERVVADVVPVFEQRPDLEIVYGNLSWRLADRILKHKQPSMITKEYLASRTVLHQTVFAQRQVFSATNGFSEKYRVVSDYEWMLKVFLRDKRNYQYVDRTVAVMDTQGRSWTTKWENERIRVMLKHFSPRDILRYRVWPRQKKAWESSARTAKRRMLQLIGRKV